MTVFVDASAIVAILDESDSAELFAELAAAMSPLWSAMSCWQAVSALKSAYKRPIEVARERVEAFGSSFGLTMITNGPREPAAALDAYQTYGKGRHPVKLNFWDCFAYACAKVSCARLLYKGDDCAQTDLA